MFTADAQDDDYVCPPTYRNGNNFVKLRTQPWIRTMLELFHPLKKPYQESKNLMSAEDSRVQPTVAIHSLLSGGSWSVLCSGTRRTGAQYEPETCSGAAIQGEPDFLVGQTVWMILATFAPNYQMESKWFQWFGNLVPICYQIHVKPPKLVT